MKTAIVTGATSGLGRALAARLSPTHAVIGTGRSSLVATDGAKPAVGYAAADQSQPIGSADRIAAAIAQAGWNRLDLAILNAGSGLAIDAVEESAVDLRNSLDVNLSAAIAISHRLHPLLDAARGKLVLIGSTAHRGAAGFASYAAAKAGLNGLARALGEEWRGRIHVQIVHPGPIATGMHAKAGFDPGGLGRLFLSPETAADAVISAIESGRSRTDIGLLRHASLLFGSRLRGRAA